MSAKEAYIIKRGFPLGYLNPMEVVMCTSNLWKEVTLSGWEQFIEVYKGLPKEDRYWIFRGEKSSSNCLRSSLERIADSFGIESTELPRIEAKLLREFKRRYHHYSNDIPLYDDYAEWLAIMQHYGAPTRLHDWTYSIFVAAFFAMDEELSNTEYCAVWAFDSTEYRDEQSFIDKHISPFTRCKENSRIFQQNGDERYFLQSEIIKFLINHPMKLVYAINPFRLNERLSIQQGVFLFPGSVQYCLVENLEGSNISSKKLTKYIIPCNASMRKDFLKRLHQMNISRSTLFPGLPGYAESMKTKMAFPEIL